MSVCVYVYVCKKYLCTRKKFRMPTALDPQMLVEGTAQSIQLVGCMALPGETLLLVHHEEHDCKPLANQRLAGTSGFKLRMQGRGVRPCMRQSGFSHALPMLSHPLQRRKKASGLLIVRPSSQASNFEERHLSLRARYNSAGHMERLPLAPKHTKLWEYFGGS